MRLSGSFDLQTESPLDFINPMYPCILIDFRGKEVEHDLRPVVSWAKSNVAEHELKSQSRFTEH